MIGAELLRPGADAPGDAGLLPTVARGRPTASRPSASVRVRSELSLRCSQLGPNIVSVTRPLRRRLRRKPKLSHHPRHVEVKVRLGELPAFDFGDERVR